MKKFQIRINIAEFQIRINTAEFKQGKMLISEIDKPVIKRTQLYMHLCIGATLKLTRKSGAEKPE